MSQGLRVNFRAGIVHGIVSFPSVRRLENALAAGRWNDKGFGLSGAYPEQMIPLVRLS